MNQDEGNLLAQCGSLQQMASVRPVVYTEGPMAGLRAYEVKNGPLQFVVMADKCMDIADASYAGINLAFLAKPGLTGRGPYDVHPQQAGRSIMGGLLFTAGLENICAPGRVDGVDYVTHGSMRTTPATHTGCDALWQDGEYVLTVKGEMRQAALFGENLVMRRTIHTVLGQNRITVIDEIQNQGFAPQPLSILYHCNAGYPLLQAGARLVLPSLQVQPRDVEAQAGMSDWDIFAPPAPGKPEQVFIHRMARDAAGRTFAAVVNDGLGLGLCVRWWQDTLPRFFEWKSEAAGDYAWGLEPANASVLGRAAQLQQEGRLHMLPPGHIERFEVCFDILQGAAEIAGLEAERDALLM